MTDARAALVEKVAKDRYEEKRARLLEAFGDTAGWPEWENLKQTLKDIEIETYAPVIDLVLEEAAKVCEQVSTDVWTELGGIDAKGWMKATAKDCANAIRALKSGT